MKLRTIVALTQSYGRALQATVQSPDVWRKAAHDDFEIMRNVKAALVDDPSMGFMERVSHIGKLSLVTIGLGGTLAAGQFLEAAGLALAERDEVLELDRIGAAYKAHIPH